MKVLTGFLFVVGIALAATFAVAADTKSAWEITVAAAADLNTALREVAANYEKQSGIKVKLSFGSSGALCQQIENGAPFDVFFSADMDYPRQLISRGQADAGSLHRYAIGKLVLLTASDSPLDIQNKGLNILIDPGV